MEELYIFIVDTDAYSGNFERELTAYITGQYGDCGVGSESADDFVEKFPVEAELFENIIAQEPDSEHPETLRPCSIWQTPGRFNDGVGNHYNMNADTKLVHAKYVESTKAYYESHIERTKRQVASGDLAWERDLKGYYDRIKEAEDTGPGKFPAYESVAIFFSKVPSKELITLMKSRATDFASKGGRYSWSIPFNIRGFRLIKKTTEVKYASLEIS